VKPNRHSVTRIGLITLVLFVLSACETTTSQKNPYQDIFDQAGVRSILVLPPVNRSVNVYAPATLLSVLPTILGNQGYYVFPVHTVKLVLQNEGLYEPAEIRAIDASELANMFGANAVLYITVEEWDTKYVVIESSTGVHLKFSLVASNGQEIWKADKRVEKSSAGSQSSNNALADLIGSAISAAWDRAFPDYRPLARDASQRVFLYDATRIPYGPYHPSKQIQQP